MAQVRECPPFLPGWLGLGDVALALADGPALEDVARAVEKLGAAAEAGRLRARGLLARKEFAAAKELAGRLVAEHPRDAELRHLYAAVLLEEGADPDAAERALREVLLLDPAHAGATHNLRLFLARRRLSSTAVFEAQGDVLAWVLAERYRAACLTPADINEHLPVLYELARGCKRVTELGTRTGVSTLAFLQAQPEKLVCYDLVRLPEVDQLAALAGRTEFVFRQEDVLQAEIEETDLLFIDTLHSYDQLREELRRHAGKARRYVVLHDTTTFGEEGELEGQRGLWPAVEEFLAEGTFVLSRRYENNNGLAVLERARD
jgi:hypothetical protein